MKIKSLSDEDKISNDLKDTLNKMIEIKDILIDNPPNDKGFNKKQFNYTLELFNIYTQIEQDNANYSTDYIQSEINDLHKRIFKNRRY